MHRFIHQLKRKKLGIIEENHEYSLTTESVNIIILRMIFLSILSFYGIIPKDLIDSLLNNNQLEEYRDHFRIHNLLLWFQKEVSFEQLDTKIAKQLLAFISEFIFKCNKESITTILGVIYEALHAEDSRKKSGTFYTPPSLARIIFQISFRKLIAKQKISKMKLSRILDYKIMDNACGGGIFLIIATEYLLNTILPFLDDSTSSDVLEEKGIESKQVVSLLDYILSKMIFGLDLDPVAVAITEAQLWLLQAEAHRKIEGWYWKNRNLRISNSLLDPSLKSNKFDLIVGNPPYMRLSSLSPAYQKVLRMQYDTKREYNLHAIFVKKSLELLRDGGVLGYLLHKNLFTLDTYKSLRYEIMKNHTCMNLVDCGHFKGATAETAIIILMKGENEPKQTITLAIYDSNTNEILKRLSIEQQDYFKLISHWNIRYLINLSMHGLNLLSHFKNLDCLGNHVSISRGIETGSNIDFIAITPKQGRNWSPILRGRDISSYHANHQSYINYNRDLLSKPGRQDLRSLPKVILQQNANHPIAYFDDGSYFALNSTTFLADAPTESLKSFCVFLNSHLVRWFFRTVITNNASLTVNILPNNLNLIPLPPAFDHKIFADICDILQERKVSKENENSEREFDFLYNVVAEAAVCEAYLPTVFDSMNIQDVLRELKESNELNQLTLKPSHYQVLLSQAKEILSNHILTPVKKLA